MKRIEPCPKYGPKYVFTGKVLPNKEKLGVVLSSTMIPPIGWLCYACLDVGNWIGVIITIALFYLCFDTLWNFFSKTFWQNPQRD